MVNRLSGSLSRWVAWPNGCCQLLGWSSAYVFGPQLGEQIWHGGSRSRPSQPDLRAPPQASPSYRAELPKCVLNGL
eukprot:116811-Amphidinium_carterae.1